MVAACGVGVGADQKCWSAGFRHMCRQQPVHEPVGVFRPMSYSLYMIDDSLAHPSPCCVLAISPAISRYFVHKKKVASPCKKRARAAIEHRARQQHTHNTPRERRHDRRGDQPNVHSFPSSALSHQAASTSPVPSCLVRIDLCAAAQSVSARVPSPQPARPPKWERCLDFRSPLARDVDVIGMDGRMD